MLFAGIAMSHYTFPNLSAESQVTTKGIFRVRLCLPGRRGGQDVAPAPDAPCAIASGAAFR